MINDCVTIMVFSNRSFATDVASDLACNTEKDKQTRLNFRTTLGDRLDRDVHTTELLIPICTLCKLKADCVVVI